jgi:RNA polymerase sigma-70 factor (ECF subfamily)
LKEAINKSINDSRDDAFLIKEFREGNTSAFEALVIKHKDKVFNLCYKFIGEFTEANDCAQETFIIVYKSLKKFRSNSMFSTWLYRIAINTCKNKLKSKEFKIKKKMVGLNHQVSQGRGNPEELIQNDAGSPDKELERKERTALIEKAINSLPIEQKTVVVLRDIEGLTYEEIAQVAGLNLGTVKSKLARARQALRDKLKRVI